MKKKNISFILNPNRIKYLMSLYGLNSNEFIELIHAKRKKQIFTALELDHVLNKKTNISIDVLKLINKTFNKGLTWYISQKNLPSPKKSSIFFRKDTFNTKLDFESKKKINEFEQSKFELQTLCKFIDYDPKRILKSYRLEDNPRDVANIIRSLFDKRESDLTEEKHINKPRCEMDFLRNSIRILDSLNIFVFEVIETWNKKNKVSFNGYFSKPNFIVLKRQDNIKREILTLFHELGHYLLKQEEIDFVSEKHLFQQSNIEKWCYSFSFYFLLGNYDNEFNNLEKATEKNNFNKKHIDSLCKKTFLSHSAFYTRLRIKNKISQKDYDNQINLLKTYFEMKKEQARIEREIAKEQGKKVFAIKKPIVSNLFKEIVKINYFEGNINESRLRDYLHISDKKSIDSVIY